MRYSDACMILRESGIENYAVEAELLIEHFCKDAPRDADHGSPELSEAIKKRCEGYPLQYILGKWWFCRCELEVSEACLCPRPDTECVVEEAVRLLPRGARFADLCTGSGCIAISLLDLRSDLSGVALELYPETLALAQRNAEKNRVSDRISFKEGDVLCPETLGKDKFFAIISNPPYIRTDVVDSLTGEVSYEPRAALDGGEDGLRFYRAMLDNFADNLDTEGCFIFEIGYDQAEDIRLLAQRLGFSCYIKKDLGGNDRVAVIKRQKIER